MAVLLAPNVIMTEVKLVAGEVALDGTNPTPISTGLRTVTAVALTLRGAGAPGDGTSAVTYEISGGIVKSTPGAPRLARTRRSSPRPGRSRSAT